jgi:hypothetical protein
MFLLKVRIGLVMVKHRLSFKFKALVLVVECSFCNVE